MSGHNDIHDLSPAFALSCPSLKDLNVSNNDLADIDVTNVPNLRKINLDNNFIFKIDSVTALRHLETVSWRQQYHSGSEEYSMMHIDDCYEVRNLFLSGNKISSFNPGVSFLNLHHLELASAGLHTLSPQFGLRMPNLRILNLNHNALKNLQPLLGLTRLQKLYVAGNRISRLRRTIAVLTRLSNSLEELDFRGNPLTVGFYLQPCGVQETTAEKRLVVKDNNNNNQRGGNHQKRLDSEDEDEDRLAQARFLLPRTAVDADEQHRDGLDRDTALRRRVYELLVLGSCQKLERLDGLSAERRRVGKRDGVWERLCELGVLKPKDGGEDGHGDLDEDDEVDA